MRWSQIMATVLLGAAAGAVAAILFAPNKGAETRDKIGKRTSFFRKSCKTKMAQSHHGPPHNGEKSRHQLPTWEQES